MLWASWDMVPRIAHKEAAHSEVCEGPPLTFTSRGNASLSQCLFWPNRDDTIYVSGRQIIWPA